VRADNCQRGFASLRERAPIGGQVFGLGDFRKLFSILIPTSEFLHSLVDFICQALITSVFGHTGFPPPASLISLFADELALILVNGLPSEYPLCNCFGQLFATRKVGGSLSRMGRSAYVPRPFL